MDGARVVAVVVHGVVQHRAVVPHDQIAGLPAVPSLEVGAGAVLEKEIEQSSALTATPPIEPLGERPTNIEGVVASLVVTADNRVNGARRIGRVLTVEASEAFGAVHRVELEEVRHERG